MDLLVPTAAAAFDVLLLHSCLLVSVSSFLIMVLVVHPLALPGNGVVCSASRAAASLPSRDDDEHDGGGVEAPPPPPPRPRWLRRQYYCERCAASSSWPDIVAAVTTSLRLDHMEMECSDSDDEGSSCSRAACGACGAAAAVEELLERKEATESELGEAFHVFDRDDDGFVGPGELWNVLRRLGMGMPGTKEADCARMIAAHDGDGDGRISFREFRAMMEQAV